METIVQVVTCHPFLVREQQPILAYKRPNTDETRRYSVAKSLAGVWYSLAAPIDHEAQWSINRTSEIVRVPLFSYHTAGLRPEGLMGAAFQLGAHALEKLESRPEALLLALGDVFEEGDRFQFWLGVAFRCAN